MRVGSIVLNLLPFVLTIATIITGLVPYKLTSEQELRKEFFYKQVQCYERLMENVSELINYSGSGKDSLRKKFED